MTSADRAKRLLLAAAVYLTAIVFFVQSFQLMKDAGLFPRYLSAFLMILNTLYVIDVLRGKDAPKKKKEEIVKSRLVGSILLAIAYVTCLNILGFMLTSLICIPVLMVILGVSSKKTILLMSIVTVAALWLFFSFFLKVPLPQGLFNV